MKHLFNQKKSWLTLLALCMFAGFAMAQPTFSKSFSPSSVDFGEKSTLTFIIDNTANAEGAMNLNFTDNFPTGMVVSSPPNVQMTGCTDTLGFAVSNPAFHTPGTFSANPGANTVSFSPGQLSGIAAGSTCTITVEVVANTTGAMNNSTGDLTSTNDMGFGGPTENSGTATATLTATVEPVHIIKKFINDPAAPGGTVDLEFTIKNLDRDFDATAVTFTDDLDNVLTGLAPSGALPTDPCGAGSMLSFSGGVLTLSNGTLAVNGGECTFIVTCQVPAGAAPGTYANTTSDVTGMVDGALVTGNEADDNLFVAAVPVFSKTFTNDPAAPGGSVDLEFSITNSSTTDALMEIAFTDDLTFLAATTFNLPANPVCGGTISQSGNVLTFSNGSLPASGNCMFTVQVDVPTGTSGGNYTNTTSELTGTINGAQVTAPAATDDLTVLYTPRISKEFTNDPVAPGGTVDLEFTIDLDGLATGDATNISFSDDLDAALTGMTVLSANSNTCGGMGTGIGTGLFSYAGGTLSPGGSCSINLTLQTPAGASAGFHTNTTSDITATAGGQTVTGAPASDDLLINPLTFTKTFLDDPVLPGESATLRFNIALDASSSAATNLFFSDDLNGMGMAIDPVFTTPLPNTPCGASSVLTPSSGDRLFLLSGGELMPGTDCTFDVEVEIPAGTASDTYTNITSSMTATVNGSTVSLPPANDNLTVNSELLDFGKSFTNDPALPGSTVDLEFTINNLDPARQIDNITFTDDLDAMLTGAVATGLPQNVCGGTLSGTSLLTFSGGSIVGGGSCTFTVTVQLPANTGGNFMNTTSTISGDISGIGVSGAPATDELKVQELTLTKSFAGPANANGTVDLTFTLQNNDAGSALTAINFNDDLNAMLAGAVAVGPLPTTPCGASSGVSGTSTLMFTAGELAPGGSCTFVVTVMVPCNAATNTYTNTTSAVNGSGSSGSFTAPAASANLMVTANTVPPTFTAPPDTTIYMDAACMYDASPSATGDVTDEMHPCCTGLNATYSDTPMLSGCNGTGTIQRTWSLMDCLGGMAADQIQTITVLDTLAPTVACNNFSAPLSATGTAAITVAQVFNAAGSSDNCSASVTAVSISQNAFDCSDIGPNAVTLTAQDDCGNMATCTATVTVVDNTPPAATCQPASYTLNASGVQAIVPADLFASGTDNCGTVNPASTNPASLNCDQVGSNTVTLTVDDGNGNTATCTSTVTILAGPFFTWYKDTDNDGYSSGDMLQQCVAPGNYQLAANLIATSGDCNDNDPFVHPDRFELCNGIDDDCDGTTDENAVTGIAVSNISGCDDKGTTDPSDDTFTADVTVIFDDIAPLGDLLLSGDGSAVVAVANMSGTSHVFTGVEMASDGSAISLSAGFTTTACVFSNTNAGAAPASCSPCEVTAIIVTNGGNCDPNGNTDPSDDTFTADVVVHFLNPPSAGTLDLTGDGTASVNVAGLNSNNAHTFTGVQMVSDGGPISLTANFSASSCSRTVANAGTAYPPCCFVQILNVAATPESCFGQNDGNIEIEAIGTGTLNYSIDGGANYQVFNNFDDLSPGGYNVVVYVEGQGCSATWQASIPTGPIPTIWWKDEDGDGFTDGTTLLSCTQPVGYLASAPTGDCDDNDPDLFPGQTWYEDTDGDGHGSGNSTTSCDRPAGHYLASELTATSGDCNDDVASIHPGATEICNGIDDNCNGTVDEGASGGLVWPGNLTFTNQQQVDTFSQCYSTIDGDLYIKNVGINDLSNLANIDTVTGFVYIRATGLTDLAGLDSLTFVGGYLRVQSNAALTTLDGLDSVAAVGGYLRVYFNDNLSDCCAIHDLLGTPGAIGGAVTIFRNDTGCDNLAEIQADCGANLIAPPAGGETAPAATGMQGISIFPNPAKGDVNLLLALPFDSASVLVKDTQGRVVLRQQLAGDTQAFPLETGRFSPGLYLVEVQVDGEVLVEKLMVK